MADCIWSVKGASSDLKNAFVLCSKGTILNCTMINVGCLWLRNSNGDIYDTGQELLHIVLW